MAKDAAELLNQQPPSVTDARAAIKDDEHETALGDALERSREMKLRCEAFAFLFEAAFDCDNGIPPEKMEGVFRLITDIFEKAEECYEKTHLAWCEEHERNRQARRL